MHSAGCVWTDKPMRVTSYRALEVYISDTMLLALVLPACMGQRCRTCTRRYGSSARSYGCQEVLLSGRMNSVPGRMDPVPGRMDPVPGRMDSVLGRMDPVPGRMDPVPGRTRCKSAGVCTQLLKKTEEMQ